MSDKGIKKNKKLITYIPFFIFLLFSLFIHNNVEMREWDDYVYRDSWINLTIIEWIKEFYTSWSGRIPLQMLHIIFLQMPVVIWRIWDSILYTLAAFVIAKLANVLGDNNEKSILFTNIVVCTAFVLLPHELLNRVIFWIAGSFNYLLPSVCLFVALYPFAILIRKKKMKKVDFIIAVIATILCCYAEQTAAIFVCMSALAILLSVFKKQNVQKRFCVLLFLGITNMAIEYFAPGNYVRYDSEVILWYPQYDMYSIFDKMMLGITFCVKMLLNYGWMIFLLIFFLMLPKILKSGWKSRVIYVTLAVYTAFLRGFLQQVNENEIFFLLSKKSVLILFLVLFWVMMMTIILFIVYSEDLELALAVAFSALAAFASGTVVAMSPSCFTSELRVFFISYLMFIFIIGLQIQGISNINVEGKISSVKNDILC